jgi:putative glutamine amidotransferase
MGPTTALARDRARAVTVAGEPTAERPVCAHAIVLFGVTTFDQHLIDATAGVTARLRRIVDDPAVAEDLCQETLVRAWRGAPRELPPERLRAWLHRTATNLAFDELRRRARRDEIGYDDALTGAGATDASVAGADVRDALGALTPHQRLVLLLRFEQGLSLRELGDLLDIGEDAARKRVARAREAFADALREVRAHDSRPTVLVLMGREEPDAYTRWLERAGARVRIHGPDKAGLDLAGADALVLSGSTTDVHPRTYGEAVDPRCVDPDLNRDLRDLAALRIALRDDIPIVGVCRGSQLLSVLFGGSLSQHVEHHEGDRPHPVATASRSSARRALGTGVEVVSDHHQAVRRLGRGLRVTATAPDGMIEAVEVPGRRLALGLQWHPERGGGEALADLLVDAAVAA